MLMAAWDGAVACARGARLGDWPMLSAVKQNPRLDCRCSVREHKNEDDDEEERANTDVHEEFPFVRSILGDAQIGMRAKREILQISFRWDWR